MSSSVDNKVVISRLGSDDDRRAFREISEEWIERHFSLTDADRRLLNDPDGQIIAAGGDVLVARFDDTSEVVGCVALIAYPAGLFELSKMGVRAAVRGRGVGRVLVSAAVDRARQLHAERLFLGTNTVLEAAQHLYREAGFEHITRAELPAMDHYARTDVLMQLVLPHGTS